MRFELIFFKKILYRSLNLFTRNKNTYVLRSATTTVFTLTLFIMLYVFLRKTVGSTGRTCFFFSWDGRQQRSRLVILYQDTEIPPLVFDNQV